MRIAPAAAARVVLRPRVRHSSMRGFLRRFERVRSLRAFSTTSVEFSRSRSNIACICGAELLVLDRDVELPVAEPARDVEVRSSRRAPTCRRRLRSWRGPSTRSTRRCGRRRRAARGSRSGSSRRRRTRRRCRARACGRRRRPRGGDQRADVRRHADEVRVGDPQRFARHRRDQLIELEHAGGRRHRRDDAQRDTSPHRAIEPAAGNSLVGNATAGRRPRFRECGFDIRDGRAFDHHAGVALAFAAGLRIVAATRRRRTAADERDAPVDDEGLAVIA